MSGLEDLGNSFKMPRLYELPKSHDINPHAELKAVERFTESKEFRDAVKKIANKKRPWPERHPYIFAVIITSLTLATEWFWRKVFP